MKYSTSALEDLQQEIDIAISFLIDIVRGDIVNWPRAISPNNKKAVNNKMSLETKGYKSGLTFQDAEDIRALYAAGGITQIQIADKYKIHKKMVSMICIGKAYAKPERKKADPVAEAEGAIKGLSCKAQVLTDSGWKLAGNLTEIDKLVSPEGDYISIISLKLLDSSPLYKMELDDGASIETAADFRFSTFNDKTGCKEGWKLRTTKRLMEGQCDHYIPTGQAAPGIKYEPLFDPYVAGLLLGDGTTVENVSSCILYSADQFIRDYMVKQGWKEYLYPNMVGRVQCPHTAESESWKDFLGRNKAGNKRVPEVLMGADPETRLAVLQGLMDTDGSIDKEGRLTFTSISYTLSKQIQYLARSLGAKSTVSWKNKESQLGGQPGYYCTRITRCNKFMPFRLPRKADRVKDMKGKHRLINKITELPAGPSIEIIVDHPSHQFMCLDFIIAHDATGQPQCRKLRGKRIAKQAEPA